MYHVLYVHLYVVYYSLVLLNLVMEVSYNQQDQHAFAFLDLKGNFVK